MTSRRHLVRKHNKLLDNRLTRGINIPDSRLNSKELELRKVQESLRRRIEAKDKRAGIRKDKKASNLNKTYKRKVYSVDEHIYRGRGLNDPSGTRTYQVMWFGELSGKKEPKARWFKTKEEAQKFIGNLKKQIYKG